MATKMVTAWSAVILTPGGGNSHIKVQRCLLDIFERTPESYIFADPILWEQLEWLKISVTPKWYHF